MLDELQPTIEGRNAMLRQVADGVLVHQSEFVQANATVVLGPTGALLIDPGVYEEEMACLANDLADSGKSVVMGFSTHPHWDHLLWHDSFGGAPRYASSRCAASARNQLADELDPNEHGIPEEVSLDLLGLISGVPSETTYVPWDGPRIRIVEHHAHAPGHAALLIEDLGVLVAGDMLSDVLIPMLDLSDDADPITDYLAGLQVLEDVADDVVVLIPGHGSVGGADQVHVRIDQDRKYVQAVRDLREVRDPRFFAPYSKDWLPGVHEQQLQNLAQRGERPAGPG
jgi:glyoxylase-like metal-dependent hydrolase (beta-lactamase superfamily II)